MTERLSTASSVAPFAPRVSLAAIEPAIALGPLDGRYRGAVAPLVDFLSEPALNRARLHVEVEFGLSLREALPGSSFECFDFGVVVTGAEVFDPA